jgi:hypothetical protein
MEILLDNQLCDYSATNPCGPAKFMGLARQTHFVKRTEIVHHLDQQIKRAEIIERRTQLMLQKQQEREVLNIVGVHACNLAVQNLIAIACLAREQK